MKNTDSHSQIPQPTFGVTFTFVGELDPVDLVKLAASTLSDNDALPLGHHQLGPVVRVDVKNVHAPRPVLRSWSNLAEMGFFAFNLRLDPLWRPNGPSERVLKPTMPSPTFDS